MKPLPVAATVAVFANSTPLIEIGVSFAWSMKNAGVCAVPPHRVATPKGGESSVGTGSTQKISDQVKRPLFASRVSDWVVLVNEESFRIPHDARIFVLNGTGIWCVTSITESTFPAVPQ